MLNTFRIYEELAGRFDEESARLLTRLLGQMYEDLQQTVTKTEFDGLRQTMRELAEAQVRSEQRLETLTQRVEELAEAQKRTEARVEELAEAQKRTEARVEELAEAQKRTEARVDALAARLEELAVAQKRTEEALYHLTKRVDHIEVRLDQLSERLEGLSNSVGYSLEDRAYRALPTLLAERGIHVQGRLLRRYLGEYQMNIYGLAQHEGRARTVVGESKVRPSRKEIDRFLKVVGRLEQAGMLSAPLPIFVANDYHPSVETYLQQKGVIYFWSYEL